MIKNFLFHRVNPKRDNLWDPMDVALFEKCVKHISSNFEVVLLEELSMSLGNKNSSTKKKATIVFDDGYKDNIEYALPILEKYKVKASFYVVTDCIDKNIPTWTHQLDYAFENTNVDEINLKIDFLPKILQVESIKGKQERINYVKNLKPSIKKIGHENRMFLMDTVLTAYNDVVFPQLMMNWEDLRQLKEKGHYIGSHTVSHCMLGTITDEKIIRTELKLSANRIREELGYLPITISYPVGSYNETTIRISKETGYKIGLAVKQKAYNPQKDDLFEIPRIELYNEPWFKTRLRISGIAGKISKMMGKV